MENTERIGRGPLKVGNMSIDRLQKATSVNPGINVSEDAVEGGSATHADMDAQKQRSGRWVSKRAREGRISAIKEMAMLSAKVEGAASLAWGLPSFRTPEPIRRAIEEKLESDPAIGMYALPGGLPELREAVAREHRRTMGVVTDPERNVMITAGNMEGLHVLLQAIVDPGESRISSRSGSTAASRCSGRWTRRRAGNSTSTPCPA
jgi:DNA-binding transcriptional MocR family regulator